MEDIEVEWTTKDKIIIESKLNLNNSEFEELVKNRDFMKVAEGGDYREAYQDYLESNPDEDDWMDYLDFKEELDMGYGHEGRIEIQRLICLSHGIYYDREYCQ